MKPPATLEELQVALDLDDPSGADIARWRDHYATLGDEAQSLINLCVEVLYEQQLCYSCGQAGHHLVDDEYPWVCRSCEPTS